MARFDPIFYLKRRQYLGKTTIAVSFEEENTKIVHASLRDTGIFVEKTETIPNDQFDIYLKKETSKEFIVTCDFTESYHNVITLPVVKARHLEKIIESEIRKTSEIKDFSFIYTIIGERVIENKKVLEVSYFAVKNEEIRKVAGRFYDNGKTIKALYPSVFSTVPLFRSEASEEAIIGVLGAKTEKTAFLIRKGAIYFIRKFKSLSTDISAIDIQDINMTINYCLQNVRINPSMVMLAGNLSRLYNISERPSIPLACLNKTADIRCSEDIFNEFIVPISSFHASRASNILNREFKNINILNNYMTNASRVFIALALLCLGLMLHDATNVLNIKGLLKSVKKTNADIESVLSDYRAKETELTRYLPVVNFLEKPVPAAQKLLIALGEIDMKNSSVNSIEAVAKDNSFEIVINGTVEADTYSSIQTAFQDLTDSLNKVQNSKITDKALDIDKKTFIIKMDYKD